MKISKYQFITGFFALVVTLAAIYIGQTFWQKHFVAQPLDQTLKSVAEIKSIKIDESKKFNDPLMIYVTLDKVSDIQKTYKFINEKIQNAYDKKAYKLVINDSRNEGLEQQYNEINYYIQEAMIDGNFPLLAQKSREIAKAQGTECKVFVDSENVYVQLSDKTGSLYEVVPRPIENSGGYEQ